MTADASVSDLGRYRLGRLLGDGWQSPERALEIQLALRLNRLRPPEGHERVL